MSGFEIISKFPCTRAKCGEIIDFLLANGRDGCSATCLTQNNTPTTNGQRNEIATLNRIKDAQGKTKVRIGGGSPEVVAHNTPGRPQRYIIILVVVFNEGNGRRIVRYPVRARVLCRRPLSLAFNKGRAHFSFRDLVKSSLPPCVVDRWQ